MEAKAPAQPALLTPIQVAETLRLSSATVLRRAHLGEIPGAFRLPGKKGRWRIKRTVFEAWVQRGCPALPVTKPGG